MVITPNPGVVSDYPYADVEPSWVAGYNIRWRQVGSKRIVLETSGLTGALRDINGNDIVVPWVDAAGYGEIARDIYPITVAGDRTYMLVGSPNELMAVYPDDASTGVTGTRFAVSDALASPPVAVAVQDTVPSPSFGEIPVTPGWAIADDGTFVVGCRRGVDDQLYVWTRDAMAPSFVILPNSPKKSVGVAILNRILIAFGCDAFDPSVSHLDTIRWSDRLDYEEWTPSDINVSGETYIENGSRIMAGGNTSFGPMCWTDRSVHLLFETGNIGSVIGVVNIDNTRGILATRAWCEANGMVWWLDANRELAVYDGGKSRQIPNPIKYATLERLHVCQTPRIYMTAHPEFGEVIIAYSTESDEAPDRQLVYNYQLDCWYPWIYSRSCWMTRIGVFPSMAVDPSQRVMAHDVDVGLPGVYLVPPPVDPGEECTHSIPPDADTVDSFDFYLETGLLVPKNAGEESLESTRLTVSGLHSSAAGAEDDLYDIGLIGFQEAESQSQSYLDVQTWTLQQARADYRVGGKALRMRVTGTGIKTVMRFGMFEMTLRSGGER